LPYLALAAVCFFWGTTYLAIRMALESFPPLLLVGARFFLSGLALLSAAGLAGASMPRLKDALYAAFFGLLTLGVGNGCLTYAELSIPSSLAALLVTTSPFWMVGIEAALPHGDRLRLPTTIGMLIGLAGTALLVGPSAWKEGAGGAIVRGFLLLQTGCLAWSAGSVLQRRRMAHLGAVVNGSLQQLAAGLGFLLPALVIHTEPVRWSARGVFALVYLMLFGSIVGYTCYVFALKKLPVAVVTIHVYVNPIVAAVLGWLVYREPFGPREMLAMAIIFLGVAVVKRYGAGQPRPVSGHGKATPFRAPSRPSRPRG